MNMNYDTLRTCAHVIVLSRHHGNLLMVLRLHRMEVVFANRVKSFSIIFAGPSLKSVSGVEGGGTNPCDAGLDLSGSWQQGHSATYNAPSRI